MTSDPKAAVLNIGVIGTGFMGRMHSHAWQAAGSLFDLPLTPRLLTICGRDQARTETMAQRFGYANAVSNWQAIVEDKSVDLVVICSPSALHEEMAVAALEAGKHVLCEKPLVTDAQQAERVRIASTVSDRIAVVGFNYRHLPAVQLARQIVERGDLGAIRYVRSSFLQDWLSDPDAPMSWRLRREEAGSGALGDLGSHTVDLVQYLTGEKLTSVQGQVETAIKYRPSAAGDTGIGEREQVDVDDTAVFSGRLESGTLATFEVSRVTAGRKAAFTFEIYGEQGSIAFDFEDLNYLKVFRSREPEAGFARVNVTGPAYAYGEGWWPAGHGLGYDAGFIHQNIEIIRAINGEHVPGLPDFASGLQIHHVIEAVESSSRDGHSINIKAGI